MSQSFYIKLTFSVYRVTELFPAGESLKDEIKQTADEILIGLICNNKKAYAEGVLRLNGLFAVAQKKNWVDPRNFSVLQREYAKLADLERDTGSNKNKRRQEAILNVLRDTGRAKIKDLAKAFPNVNRRTLLRDLGLFCQAGLIERNGGGRGACYTIKNATFYREMSQLA